MKKLFGLTLSVAFGLTLAGFSMVVADAPAVDTALVDVVVVKKQPDTVLAKQKKARVESKEFSKKMDEWYRGQGNKGAKDERALLKRAGDEEKKGKVGGKKAVDSTGSEN
jgi:hypothetical protein